jgi:DNA repair protein RecO (recombination protein O)
LLAGYFGQLLELVLELDHPEPEIWDLLRRGLEHLETNGASRRAMFHFEREVARMLGLGKGAHLRILKVYGKLPNTRNHCLELLGQK